MVPTLIDTHAHLTSDALAGDVDGVIARAREAGVGAIITIGTDAADSQRAVDLAAARPEVFASVGIHPHEAGKVTADDFAALEALTTHPRVVAIGELGLDYYYDFADRAAQRTAFEHQLAIAARFDRPLVIHCRDSMVDTVDILRLGGFAGRRVVFHCFTGSAPEAALIADHGWRISFTGIVTYRRSTELQEIARAYPLDQLMIETDSPYLSPEPVRSKRPNEPAHVRHVAQFLAGLRGVEVGEIAVACTANANRFFGLEL